MKEIKQIDIILCEDCDEGDPPKINKADHLIPFRTEHYGMLKDGSDIDRKVVGICKKCLKKRNKFQQDNKQAVDVNHPHLVLRNV
ncbi:MAG: hypothetical protein Unbinned5350contig1004_46 [Prokaryotic dsDNA virus sp.]|nr:MAG: hypothetical protein Unbinned5350contig1004_46 [Prokaryotic dsDNA virus sp.]|tara:strand:+ start:1870 stop:2124 length:255 start_codon:yes stop_codon:yes gene_type:complete